MPRIPLIEDLTTEAVQPASNLLVEFDPSTQWHNAHVTIAAGWLRTGGKVMYHISAYPRERIRTQLKRLGLGNVEELEKPRELPTLALNDWYTATLGHQTKEDDLVVDSLKVADLSISWAKGEKEFEITGAHKRAGPPALRIFDNISSLARFNDEKSWVEFVLARLAPRATKWNQVAIIGITKGLHSDWVYKTLEGAAEGIIDLKLEEKGDETRDLMRIRTMRNVGFDRKWHELRVGENSEVTLEK